MSKLVQGVQVLADEAAAVTEAFEWWNMRPVEPHMEVGKTKECNPKNSLDNQGHVLFSINNNVKNFIYLPSIRLEGDFSVVKADTGLMITDLDDISIINNTADSLFEQVECQINGKEVMDLSASLYPYKAYFENLLSYSQATKDTHLKTVLWQEDYAGTEETIAASQVKKFSFASSDSVEVKIAKLLDFINEVAISDPKKNGYMIRQKWIHNGPVHFITPLHVDLFNIGKFLPPGCNLDVSLAQNKSDFILLGEASKSNVYKIQINNLKMTYRDIKCHEDIIGTQLEMFRTHKMGAVDFNQATVRSYSIDDTRTHYDFLLADGPLPKKIFMGFVKHSASSSCINANPFYFQHCNINNLVWKINGENYPPQSHRPDFSNNNNAKYYNEYRALNDCIGIGFDNRSNGISPEDFKNGNCIFTYDNDPDSCNNYHIHQPVMGSCRVSFDFHIRPSVAMTAIVYMAYDKVFAIDEQKQNPVIKHKTL